MPAKKWSGWACLRTFGKGNGRRCSTPTHATTPWTPTDYRAAISPIGRSPHLLQDSGEEGNQDLPSIAASKPWREGAKRKSTFHNLRLETHRWSTARKKYKLLRPSPLFSLPAVHLIFLHHAVIQVNAYHAVAGHRFGILSVGTRRRLCCSFSRSGGGLVSYGEQSPSSMLLVWSLVR